MRLIILALALMAGAARAETPAVVTDIAPMQSLVAQVMGDLGTPAVLLAPGEDPHHFQMRPSQARQLTRADLVIWVGPAMTPWLDRVVDTLGHDTASVTMLADPDEHDNTDHSHAHAHGSTDPHVWLDPVQASVFLGKIAIALAEADPGNATAYHENKRAAQARLKRLTDEVTAQMQPLRHHTLLPYHDGFRAFFTRFNLQYEGALAQSDATPPSAARLAEVQDIVSRARHVCLFSEPGGNDRLIRTIQPNGRLAQLDPLGATLPPGPALYESLIRDMAQAIASCDQP